MATTTTTANGLAEEKRAMRIGTGFGRNTWLLIAGLALLPVVVAFLPLVGGPADLISTYTFLQLSLMIVYSVAVLGLNLLTGFNGQISLGHGAFFAAGAYCAAALVAHLHWPHMITLPAVALFCFVIGYLFGLPALRLEGHYLALATFSLAIAVPQILKYRHLEGVTGGVQGLNLPKITAPLGLPFTPDQWMYLLVLAVAVPLFWFTRNLLDSRTGRALMAIRDQPMAAATMGINISQYKAVTFGLSAMITGIAGAMHAGMFRFVAPDSYPLELSITLLVGMVVGGLASLPGAIFGGIFVQVIEKYADSIARELSSTLRLPIDIEPWTIYGIALILLVYFMPTGIAGGIARLRQVVKTRSRRADGA
jgi:branched-chain amino acid transport system permease protein